MSVGISASFTKDTKLYNGLEAIHDELLSDPNELRTAVITYRVGFSKRDFRNGGVETPTIQIMEIEPLIGDAVDAGKKLQKEAFHKRTGNPMPDLLDLIAAQQDEDD